MYGDGTSFAVCLMCSVLQGSVLGPLLFIVYTADLVMLVAKHCVNLYAYPDDMQLYLHFNHDDAVVSTVPTD